VAIGIGVNLVHAPERTRYGATSLAEHGAHVAPDEAFARLAAAMTARLAEWNDGRDFAAIRRDWTARAAGLGRLASVTMGERTVTGDFTGLASDGALLLSEPGGQLHVIHAGEVARWRCRGPMSKLHRPGQRRFNELVFCRSAGRAKSA
jgi:BirA family transcriptional regulator, biotin operon repressor / biotin---[acetyl-CoA-carboxylase] ligase